MLRRQFVDRELFPVEVLEEENGVFSPHLEPRQAMREYLRQQAAKDTVRQDHEVVELMRQYLCSEAQEIVRRLLEGLTFEEIATELGTNPDAVKLVCIDAASAMCKRRLLILPQSPVIH